MKKTILFLLFSAALFAGTESAGSNMPLIAAAILLLLAAGAGYWFFSRRGRSHAAPENESGPKRKGAETQEALEAYRIEMQQIQIDIQPFRLSGMLHILTNKISEALKEHRHVVHYDVDKNVGRYIVGDNDYIEQVLEVFMQQAIALNSDAEIVLNISKYKEKSLVFDIGNSTAVRSKTECKEYMEAEESSGSGDETLEAFIKAKKIVQAMGGTVELKCGKRNGIHYIFTLPYYADKGNRSNQEKLKKVLAGKRALFVGKTKYHTLRVQYIFEIYGIKIENMSLGDFEKKKPDLSKYDMVVLRSVDLLPKHISFLKTIHQKSDLKIIIIHELFEQNKKIALSKPVADAELYNPAIIGDVEEILYQMYILKSKAVKGISNMEIFDPSTFTIKGSRDVTQHDLEKYRGAHIAIAEDSKVDQRVMKSILALDGIRVFCVNNGAELLKLLEDEEIDMVFTDINMPIMDGIKATKKIRAEAKWAQLPIISISSMAFMHEVKAMQVAGMNASISKPIVAQDVYRALERFLTVTPAMRARYAKKKEERVIPEYDKEILDIEQGINEMENEAQYKEVLSETMDILKDSRKRVTEMIQEEKKHALLNFARSTQVLYKNIHAHEMVKLLDEMIQYLSAERTPFLSEYITLYQKGWQKLEHEAKKYLSA